MDFGYTRRVDAESLSVSLQVGTTAVVFSGYTSPNALVTIKEDSVVVATTTSNSLGNWIKNVTVAVPSLHTYTLTVVDESSRTSASVSYNLSVSGGTTTTVANIVMPPTTSLSGSLLSGSSYPGSTLTITVSSGDTANLTVPTSGNWSYDLSSFSLSGGSYTITATTTVSSYLSLASTALSYTASAPSPSPTPPPSTSATPLSSPDLPNSPSPSPTPFFIPLYDQNADGRLTLTELFGTVKSWLLALLPCDLNHDQRCNLIDLSILLYYFER